VGKVWGKIHLHFLKLMIINGLIDFKVPRTASYPRRCKLATAIATVNQRRRWKPLQRLNTFSWLYLTLKNSFRKGSNRDCNGPLQRWFSVTLWIPSATIIQRWIAAPLQRLATVPLEAVATAKYLLLAIFHPQKQLLQWLQPWLQHPNLSKKEIVLSWLRNVLEVHLQFKFYRQLSGLQPNRQTFGNLIGHLVTQNVVFRDDSNRTTIISKLNLINGISCRPHHGDPIPDYSTLGSNPNTMTVTELAHFVTDTLNLVDNEL